MEDLLYKLLLGGAALAFFSLGFYLGYLSGYGVAKLHREIEEEVRHGSKHQKSGR